MGDELVKPVLHLEAGSGGSPMDEVFEGGEFGDVYRGQGSNPGLGSVVEDQEVVEDQSIVESYVFRGFVVKGVNVRVRFDLGEVDGSPGE